MTKKVKISSVKRAQHLKSKKNFAVNQKSKSTKSAISSKNATDGPPKFHQNHIFKKKANAIRKYQKPLKKHELDNNNNDDDDEQIINNISDIIDPEDLELLELNRKTTRKRKHAGSDDEDDEIESASKKLEYEHAEHQAREKMKGKHVVNLLPIKSKDGEIISRSVKIDRKPKKSTNDEENENYVKETENDVEAEIEYEDSDDDIIKGVDDVTSKANFSTKMISTTDLLILREQEIESQKYRIGIICSGILEKPEDKMKNFSVLFQFMDEKNEKGSPNLLSVRKIATASIAEIFKDILPEYRVGQVDTKSTKVRKTTLERVKYENALLHLFKKYLLKLEQIIECVTKKGGQKTPWNIKMAEVAVNCLCDILIEHPYFNYVQNVAQLLVYVLNCNYPQIRKTVNECFRAFFNADKKLDMTLFIIRRINHLIKAKSNNVHVDMITCFMGLKIKNVNLDLEKENELKQKKLEAHRQRLLNLSKRERKRRKRLAELNKELQETKAEENKQTKHYKLTEITKMLFTIYFRLLKNDPNSKLLSHCLEGLAEFAHVINLEFFSDLIEVLNRLLESGELGFREELHCIQTIFAILSGQGEFLNIDPIRFYGHCYRNLLVVNAGRNHNDILIILKILNDVLIKRRKNITQYRLLAFIKRISILCLQLLNNGALAAMGIVKNVMQLTSATQLILDTDSSIGTGRYEPELEDPEYCNASCTSLYELTRLMKHYHPTVRKMATHIANGVPATGEGSLPPEIGKLTPEELFKEFDSSEMAFNPCIPTPKPTEPKLKKGKHLFLDKSLKRDCKLKINEFHKNSKIINFLDDFKLHK